MSIGLHPDLARVASMAAHDATELRRRMQEAKKKAAQAWLVLVAASMLCAMAFATGVMLQMPSLLLPSWFATACFALTAGAAYSGLARPALPRAISRWIRPCPPYAERMGGLWLEKTGFWRM